MTNVKLIAYRSGKHNFFTLRADMPGSKGVDYIWFCMVENDIDLFAKHSAAIVDIGHVCMTLGDLVSFFDWNYPSGSSGRTDVKYYNANIPHPVRVFMVRWAKLVWAQRERDGSDKECEVVITSDRINKWLKNYGRGTGKLNFNCPTELPNDEKLLERVEYVKHIALNHTSAYYHQVKMSLYMENPKSYYFVLSDENNKRIMNGGIVNHGTEDKPDWSVHT